MQKDEKERVVAELTERLRRADTLIVADYRGLTMTEIDALRGRAARARREVHRRQEHAGPDRCRGVGQRRVAGAPRGPIRDRASATAACMSVIFKL